MIDNTDKKIKEFQKFLNILEKKICEKNFEKDIKKVQEIDLKHYSKILKIDELKKDIFEYKKIEITENKFKNLQVLLPGNPEIVFKLCLEAIKYDLNIFIYIEDFCLAQNIFIVEFINEIIKDLNFKNIIKIKNLLKDSEIIENSKKVDSTICIGNSNLYNRLDKKIENLKLNPYGIFEVYSDSEEFEELKEKIFEYTTHNQYELEIYDDLEFKDTIKLINKVGYGFCSILMSKDKEKIKEFEENINSKYIIINENPFKKIKFELFV